MERTGIKTDKIITRALFFAFPESRSAPVTVSSSDKTDRTCSRAFQLEPKRDSWRRIGWHTASTAACCFASCSMTSSLSSFAPPSSLEAITTSSSVRPPGFEKISATVGFSVGMRLFICLCTGTYLGYRSSIPGSSFFFFIKANSRLLDLDPVKKNLVVVRGSAMI
eukprot:SAG11_NODE_73_length_18072_cov_8.670005_18_plen_166_part_00